VASLGDTRTHGSPGGSNGSTRPTLTQAVADSAG
jgi:hypothetical protein